MKHIGLKITAFIFGIAVWMYVMSLNTFQLTITVPVRLVKLPEMLAIASKPPQSLSITLEGEPFELMRLRNRIKDGDSSVASVIIDLQDAELGSSRMHISAKNFSAPAFPNIKFIEPDNQFLFVDIELDTKIERHIPIRSNVVFNVESGYLLTDEPKLTPDFITVAGARNTITRIIEIPTDSLNFDSLQHDSVYSIPLNFNQISSYVKPSDSKIDISVNVQKISKKQFEKIPVQLIGRYDKNAAKLVPDTIAVEITGGDAILDSITDKNVELFIEINRFAIEDVDSLAPTIKLKLNSKINRERSIKAMQTIPDKVSLVKTEIKPVEPDTTETEEEVVEQ